MTEGLDDDRRSRSPSSDAIDIARLRERHNALRDDMGEMKGDIHEIKNLLQEIRGAQITIHGKLEAGVLRMNTTDERLMVIESDRRSVAGMIAGLGGVVGSIVTAVWVAIKGP